MLTPHECTWSEVRENIFELFKRLIKAIICLIFFLVVVSLVIAGISALVRMLRRR